MGYVIILNNGAVARRSQRQPTVALSSMDGEYMQLTETTKGLLWMRGFLTELGYENDHPTDLFTDSQSVLALAKNTVSNARAKHIDARYHFVRDAI